MYIIKYEPVPDYEAEQICDTFADVLYWVGLFTRCGYDIQSVSRLKLQAMDVGKLQREASRYRRLEGLEDVSN